MPKCSFEWRETAVGRAAKPFPLVSYIPLALLRMAARGAPRQVVLATMGPSLQACEILEASQSWDPKRVHGGGKVDSL